jgi:hypothetical protein
MDISQVNNASIQKTWTSSEEIGPGIWVYRNVFTPEMNVTDRIESYLKEDPNYAWQPAYVGYQQLMPEYRDCVDFKFKKSDIENDKSPTSLNLQQLWQDCYDRKVNAVEDYAKRFNINNLRYWEAFNFIRYGEGQHFMEHHDHGYSYNCTVSLVGYPNDDYEGGELYFRLQNLKVKPQAGDLYIFPSNFMYPHQAMPVTSGIKYSIVTMLDYSEKYHTAQMYQETGK